MRLFTIIEDFGYCDLYARDHLDAAKEWARQKYQNSQEFVDETVEVWDGKKGIFDARMIHLNIAPEAERVEGTYV